MFHRLLADVAQQIVPFKLPYGLLDGLTLRWYEAIAEGDALTYGDLPQVRCIHSVPELFLTDVRIQDDLSVTVFCHQAEILTIPAEVFCLPTGIRAALASNSARVSESVIQCCGGVWWLWLVFTNLDVPLQAPTLGTIGLDPGVKRWLSGYDDAGPVIFPGLRCASVPTLAARFAAYERQRETIEGVSATLLQYQLVAHLKAGFLCSILDQVASAGLRTAERRLLQIPAQFSSSVDADNQWLPRDAYRPGRIIVENGHAFDRDILAARTHYLRLRQHHLACPRWWQILPLEFDYLRGLRVITLVPKPRRTSFDRAAFFKTA